MRFDKFAYDAVTLPKYLHTVTILLWSVQNELFGTEQNRMDTIQQPDAFFYWFIQKMKLYWKWQINDKLFADSLAPGE